jgi:hypothetical protein
MRHLEPFDAGRFALIQGSGIKTANDRSARQSEKFRSLDDGIGFAHIEDRSLLGEISSDLMGCAEREVKIDDGEAIGK